MFFFFTYLSYLIDRVHTSHVYVCICTYICVCIYIYIVHTYIYSTYIHIHICVCVYKLAAGESPGDTWDVNPLEVQDDLAGIGVPELEDDVLGHLAVLPCDVALRREAVLLVRVDRLHHRAVAEMAVVLLGDLDEVQDAELRVAHAVVLGEGVLVKHFLRAG